MAITKVSELVKAIRNSSSKEEAINNYSGLLDFSEKWISSVYDSRGELEKIDPSFDVNTIGKTILQSFGFDEDTQINMWEKWLKVDDDTKSGWIEDFNLLDMNETKEVELFLEVISKYLLK